MRELAMAVLYSYSGPPCTLCDIPSLIARYFSIVIFDSDLATVASDS